MSRRFKLRVAFLPTGIVTLKQQTPLAEDAGLASATEIILDLKDVGDNTNISRSTGSLLPLTLQSSTDRVDFHVGLYINADRKFWPLARVSSTLKGLEVES